MSYTLEVIETEKGELLLQFPNKLLEELKWKTGDEIEWIDNKNNSFTLRKVIT